MIGAAGVLMGAWRLVSPESPMPEGSGCKALCGWSLLAAEFLGATAGRWVLGGLQIALGGVLAWGGLRLLKH
ncbi:hypothetical protein CDN99_12040 [Roseateles aquatilis]|uniref:Uncharacterized protein n=1 Tax=Roseateles aquatilis TaxID=431061 RepID=A0A246JE77_9BURK|nr:hypothetical protein CDN99_12040 [Roseateles aquatilis]